MHHWLTIERYENWLTDKAEGFVRFGFPERKLKLAKEIENGDLFITYISGKCAFSGIRRVISQDLGKLSLGGNYDAPFPYFFRAEPILTLEEKFWIPANDLIPKLDFAKGAGDWRGFMRTSFRKLSEGDGIKLKKILKGRSTV